MLKVRNRGVVHSGRFAFIAHASMFHQQILIYHVRFVRNKEQIINVMKTIPRSYERLRRKIEFSQQKHRAQAALPVRSMF